MKPWSICFYMMPGEIVRDTPQGVRETRCKLPGCQPRQAGGFLLSVFLELLEVFVDINVFVCIGVTGIDIIGIEKNGLLAGGERFFVAFKAKKRNAFVDVCLGMVGIEAKDLLIGGECFFV